MEIEEFARELEEISEQMCLPHCRTQWMIELVDYAAHTADRWGCDHND